MGGSLRDHVTRHGHTLDPARERAVEHLQRRASEVGRPRRTPTDDVLRDAARTRSRLALLRVAG